MSGLSTWVVALVLAQLPPAVAVPEGAGVRLGDKSRLHLSIEAGTGYDSNPNLASEKANSVLGTSVLLVRPRSSIRIPSRRYQLDAAVNLAFRNYTTLRSGTGNSNIRLFGGDFQISLTPVSRTQPVSVEVFHSVTRSVEPGVALPGTRVASTLDSTQLKLVWAVPERRFGLVTDYSLQFQIFDKGAPEDWASAIGLSTTDRVGGSTSSLDNLSHRLSLTGEWQAPGSLSAQAAVIARSMSYLYGVSPFPSDHRVNTEASVAGPVPTLTSVDVSVRAGTGLAKPGPAARASSVARRPIEWTGVYVSTSLTYALNTRHSVTLSLRRDVDAVVIYRRHESEQAYIDSVHDFPRRVQLQARIGYARHAYLADNESLSPSRRERFFEVQLQAGVPVKSWLAIGASTAYQVNSLRGASSALASGGVDTSYRRIYCLLTLSVTR